MTFSFSVNCISYAEPLLWVAIALGSMLASWAGVTLVRFLRRKPTGVATVIALPMLLALPLGFLLSLITLTMMYPVVRSGQVCVHFVRPAFVLPLIVTSAFIVRSALHPSAQS